MSDTVRNSTEETIYKLRLLYSEFGYTKYQMNKFEEYDFYANNKDFLISDNIITFTDTNGKLMALKPDVTLSIIKNMKESSKFLQKLYYDESVYRVSKATRQFQELPQVGLECIGNIDDYSIYEVTRLAAMSLKLISSESVLDISHQGVLQSIMDSLKLSKDVRGSMMKCIEEKNEHELARLCRENDVAEDVTTDLCKLISLYGSPEEVLEKAASLTSLDISGPLQALAALIASFDGEDVLDMMRIDFSVAGDMKYYNGIVFKGFVNGVPNSVLSGGQYDKLMEKNHRKSGAIGFAVYLDMIQRLNARPPKYDVDVLVVYDDSTSVQRLAAIAQDFRAEEKTVAMQQGIPSRMRYGELYEVAGGELKKVDK